MRKTEGWNQFFADNHRYADLINGIGCGGIQFVKDTDLAEVDTTEGKKSRDILRKVAFGVNFAIVGIENQESHDYEMPLRTMSYDVSQYEKQLKACKRKNKENIQEKFDPGEYLYGFRKDDRLHPVITFVLYAGDRVWDGPYSLCDMIDFTDIPEELRAMVSDYRINVISIRQFENTDVFQTDVKQVFDFIRCSKDKKKLLELVENDVYYSQMDDDAYDVVIKYTNSKELVKVKEEVVEGEKNNMCKAIRDLMNDSREEGREKAFVEKTRTTVINMLKENLPMDKICRIAECDESYVATIRAELLESE